MTYNIESIISDLTSGKSESEIAQELSDMLNDAIKQKKAQDEENERKLKEQANEKREKLIRYCATTLLDAVPTYLSTIEAEEIYDALMADWDVYVDDLTNGLIEIANYVPMYSNLLKMAKSASSKTETKTCPSTTDFASKTASKTSPAISSRGKAEPKVTVTKDNIDLLSDEEIDKFLSYITKSIVNG